MNDPQAREAHQWRAWARQRLRSLDGTPDEVFQLARRLAPQLSGSAGPAHTRPTPRATPSLTTVLTGAGAGTAFVLAGALLLQPTPPPLGAPASDGLATSSSSSDTKTSPPATGAPNSGGSATSSFSGGTKTSPSPIAAPTSDGSATSSSDTSSSPPPIAALASRTARSPAEQHGELPTAARAERHTQTTASRTQPTAPARRARADSEPSATESAGHDAAAVSGTNSEATRHARSIESDAAQHARKRTRAQTLGAGQNTERELALVTAAHAALEAQPARALALAERHARSFPRGLFAEEREIIAMEAELRLQLRAAGLARARRFLARFPHSTHAPRLRTLLSTRGTPAGAAHSAVEPTPRHRNADPPHRQRKPNR